MSGVRAAAWGMVRASRRMVILRFTAVRHLFSPFSAPLQPLFRLSPDSGAVLPGYGDGAGRHRFRLSPE